MTTDEQLKKITAEVRSLQQQRVELIPHYATNNQAWFQESHTAAYANNWKQANSIIDAESKAKKAEHSLLEKLRKEENQDPELYAKKSKHSRDDAINAIVNRNLKYYVAIPRNEAHEYGNDYVESVCEMYLEDAKRHAEAELYWHQKQLEAIYNSDDYHNENRRVAANTRWAIQTNKHWEESLKEYRDADAKRLISSYPHIWEQIAKFYWEDAWHWAQAELVALTQDERQAAIKKWDEEVAKIVTKHELQKTEAAKKAAADAAVQKWLNMAEVSNDSEESSTISQQPTSFLKKILNTIRRLFYIRARDPETLMTAAIKANDVNSVALLLTSHKIALSNNSRRWLFNAAENGQTKIIELLVNAGVSIHEDPKSPYAIGIPPLLAAASKSHSEAVRELIIFGADLDAVVTSTRSDNKNLYGKTTLGSLLENEKVFQIEEIARLLIANGASIGEHHTKQAIDSGKIIATYLPRAASLLAFYWDTPDHYIVADDSALLNHAVDTIIAPDLQRVFALSEEEAIPYAEAICNVLRSMTTEEILEHQRYVLKPIKILPPGQKRLLETLQVRIGKHFREHLDPTITGEQLILEFQNAFMQYVPADKLHYMQRRNRDQMVAMAQWLADKLPPDQMLGLQDLHDIFKKILLTATEAFTPTKPSLFKRITDSIVRFFIGDRSTQNLITLRFDPEAINTSNERLKTWILKNLNFRLQAVAKMLAAVENRTLPESTQAAINTEISMIENDWEKFVTANSDQQTLEAAQQYVQSRTKVFQIPVPRRTWLPSARLSRKQNEADVVQELANVVALDFKTLNYNEGGNRNA